MDRTSPSLAVALLLAVEKQIQSMNLTLPANISDASLMSAALPDRIRALPTSIRQRLLSFLVASQPALTSGDSPLWSSESWIVVLLEIIEQGSITTRYMAVQLLQATLTQSDLKIPGFYALLSFLMTRHFSLQRPHRRQSCIRF